MLPFDYGTTPATDAGIRASISTTPSRPACRRASSRGTSGFNFGSGLGVNRCNCPLDQDEKQLQLVGNVTQMLGATTRQVRRRHQARVEPARAERRASLGRADIQRRSDARPDGGGLGLATFLLGDVTHFGRYVSPFTDARRAAVAALLLRAGHVARDTSKLTLNYGLRLDVINPQTVSGDGKGGFLLASVTTGRSTSRRPTSWWQASEAFR